MGTEEWNRKELVRRLEGVVSTIKVIDDIACVNDADVRQLVENKAREAASTLSSIVDDIEEGEV